MVTSKDNYNINFTGLTHDHFQSSSHANCATKNGQNNHHHEDNQKESSQLCSVIAILRRHPMYDCLLLVKKYRNCLAGYSLEFPIDRLQAGELRAEPGDDDDDDDDDDDGDDQNDDQHGQQQDENKSSLTANKNNNWTACNQRRLVSRYLDGDDPMHQHTTSPTGTTTTTTTTTDATPLPPVVSELIRNTSYETTNAPGGPAASEPVYLVDPFMEQLDDRGDHCELVHVPINGLLDRLERYTRDQVAVDSRVYSFAMGLKTAERIMTTKSMKELQETPI